MVPVTIHGKPASKKPIFWEVVLYRRPRHLESYCHRFKNQRAAILFADLNRANPNWSEIHIHAILQEFADLTFTHQ